MDKYQNAIINEYFATYYLIVSNKGYDNQILKGDNIVLTQDEDISISDYKLQISNYCIKEIYYKKGSKFVPFLEENVKSKYKLSGIFSNPVNFYIPIDFEKPINSIKIVFKNNLADDLVLSLSYVLADKEKYNARVAKAKYNKLLENAKVSCACGADLVNIYFQPCCEAYARTEIYLYRDNVLLAKYKTDDDVYFKTISGLAYGTYYFVLKQFDSKNKLLIETAKIKFVISSGSRSSIPVVRIGF